MIPLLTLGLSALAAEPTVFEQTLVDALGTHQQELTLGEDAPPIYHLRYHLMSMEQVDVQASLGHPVKDEADPFRLLAVELRVGEPGFDNTGLGGWENGFGAQWLPQVLTPHALDQAAWRLTDGAYKQAVEQYSRKKAQFRPPEDYPGDYTLTEPVVVRAEPVPVSDAAPLVELARELSSLFADVPGVERGEVYIGHEAGSHTIVDTGGVRVVRPVSELSMRAVLHVRAKDGMLLTDSRLWSVRGLDDLPPREALVAEVTAMRDELLALSEAPVLNEEVVGPVVFTDGAARDLFRALLLPQLEGTPAEVPFDSFLGDLGRTGSSVRLGRRVLPPGWAVGDDPARDLSHPGAFTHDYEGTPTQDVQLVEDGIVRQVLMSRVPRKDTAETNGHARGGLNTRLSGRPVDTLVEPDRHRSRKQVHKRAARLASAYGRDWYLRVERLQEPSVRNLGSAGGMFSFGDDEDVSVPRPVKLVKVYADGREEILRGGAFSGVQRFALRDIVAAGAQTEGSFFLPPEPGGSLYTPTGGLPTWISVPEVLVGELEVLPTPGDPKDAPLLPHPATVATK